MVKERFKLVPWVCLILKKEGKILLIRRKNTGTDDGLYACAGGGVDGNETVIDAMIREACEELGIKLKKDDLKVIHVLHGKRDSGVESIGFFITATKWEGVPQNMEPNKCDDVSWFLLDNLPKNTTPLLKHVLDMINKNIIYSESGWEYKEKRPCASKNLSL